jgi:hypothetical protein
MHVFPLLLISDEGFAAAKRRFGGNCLEFARVGGQRCVEILGREVMTTKCGTMNECCFANVALPIRFVGKGGKERIFGEEEAGKIVTWIIDRGWLNAVLICRLRFMGKVYGSGLVG